MVIIGIDMSKNSPGVCIRKDDKLEFLSFIRDKEKKSNKLFYEQIKELGISVNMNPRTTAIKEYSELEVFKVHDATLLAKSIVDSLPDEIDMVGIEGFSYGSKGNAGLDIAGYAYCVRTLLYQKYGYDKICIFSPGNVKKTAGKGNAGKEEMMEFFLNCQDKDLIETKFWKALKNKELEPKKPCDDLIDSYYVQECSRRYLESKIIDTIE